MNNQGMKHELLDRTWCQYCMFMELIYNHAAAPHCHKEVEEVAEALYKLYQAAGNALLED